MAQGAWLRHFRAQKLFTHLSLISLAASLAACKARGFNTEARPKSESAGAASGTGAAFLPPLVDAKLLKTDPAYPATEQPPQDFTEDAILSLGKPYVTLLGDDFKPPKWLSSGDGQEFANRPTNMLEYENKRKAAGFTPSIPLAAEEVLEILRRNRTEFGVIVEGGRKQKPRMLGAAIDESSTQIYAQAVIPDGARILHSTACGPYDPRNYSDIKWHYYCTIPGLFRGCQRVTVGYSISESNKAVPSGGAEALEKVNAFAAKEFEDVKAYCLNPDVFPVGPLKAEYEDKVYGMQTRTSGLPAGTFARMFKLFYESQYVTNKRGERVNMYDYLMRSQPYAFSFEQQQAVLNTFYGEMKPAAEGAFDPHSKADCKKYRDVRNFIEQDMPGTHCDPSAPRPMRVYSQGR